MTAKTYLVRGMLAGLLAGLCALAFAKMVAEPQIASAEQFERQLQLHQGKPADTPLVSRDVQDTVGLGTGVAVVGVALGGFFGLCFAGAYRRLSGARAKVMAAWLAAGGFLAIFLVPFLKYPANPPSVGNPDTIGRRTALYFLLIAVALLSVSLAVLLHRRFVPRFGAWDATVLAAAVLISVIAVSYVVMPGINEVPGGFPASVLWKFRLASLGTQLVFWVTLSMIFGEITERRESAVSRTARAVPRPSPRG